MITAGSRLFLAMAEAKLNKLGSNHAYMDTDSVFIPPERAQDIIDYFQLLNPYSLDIPLLKAETLGVSRSTFQGIKKRIRESGDVNLCTPAVRRLEPWEGF